jgi:hypothetical protein
MLFLITTPPPPPAYQVFVPMAMNGNNIICSPGYVETTCDYVYKDSKSRWYVTDEGIYSVMTSRHILTINGIGYYKVDSGSSEICPENDPELARSVLYIHMDGLYYWSIIVPLGSVTH